MRLTAAPAVPLEERLALERLLDEALEPLGRASAPISAARVRARVRWSRDDAPAREPLVAFVPRLAQSAMTAAVLALVFVVPAGEPRDVEPPSVMREYFRAQPPFEERDLVRWNALQQRGPAPAAAVDDMLRADAQPLR